MPLAPDHAEGWFSAAQATGPEAWRWLSRPFPRTLTDARTDIEAALSAQEQQSIWPTEEFELALSYVPVPADEDDLFAGIGDLAAADALATDPPQAPVVDDVRERTLKA